MWLVLNFLQSSQSFSGDKTKSFVLDFLSNSRISILTQQLVMKAKCLFHFFFKYRPTISVLKYHVYKVRNVTPSLWIKHNLVAQVLEQSSGWSSGPRALVFWYVEMWVNVSIFHFSYFIFVLVKGEHSRNQIHDGWYNMQVEHFVI